MPLKTATDIEVRSGMCAQLDSTFRPKSLARERGPAPRAPPRAHRGLSLADSPNIFRQYSASPVHKDKVSLRQGNVRERVLKGSGLRRAAAPSKL
eukprot:scaffold12689_cov74-Isochrysis_galbana.AAC.3